MSKEEKTLEEVSGERLPAVKEVFSDAMSVYMDEDKFEMIQRAGKMFAGSNLVPTQFRDNIPNCVIALNLANRMKADPFMLMQNMYVVHGKPAFEGKFYAALVNQCGRYTPLKYIFEGEGDERGCTAQGYEKKSGELIQSTPVTWKMVLAEGWDKNSKWHSMTDLMFCYRAAAFFARVHCPDVTMGMHTIEEVEDFDLVRVERNEPVKLDEVVTSEVVKEIEAKKEEKPEKENQSNKERIHEKMVDKGLYAEEENPVGSAE